MDVRANIMAQTQAESDEFRRDSISEGKSRSLETERQDVKSCEIPVSPHFVIPPKDAYIVSNETGIIEARIFSVPKPIVRWYKNGQLITSSMYPRIKKHHYIPETYALEIPQATYSDMGSYSCIARNCYGSITSSATLHIVDLETEEFPGFLKRLKRTDVLADSNSHLEVRVSGEPKPQVEWFKDSMPLKENNRIETCHKEPRSYVLRLKNAKPEDSGLYTCKATNKVGTSSTSAMVYVEKAENLNKKWTEDLACRQLERYQCPIGWSQREMDDYLYRISVANYHIKHRIPSSGYSNLF